MDSYGGDGQVPGTIKERLGLLGFIALLIAAGFIGEWVKSLT